MAALYGFLEAQGVLHFTEENDSLCDEVLFDNTINGWTKIKIDDGACEEIKKPLNISGYNKLTSITVGEDALAAVTVLTVKNNTLLTTVSIAAGIVEELPSEEPGVQLLNYGSFSKTETVTIKDNAVLSQFDFKANTFINAKTLTLSGNPALTTFANGENCLPILETVEFGDEYTEISIHAETFTELTAFAVKENLQKLIIGDDSLTKVTGLVLDNHDELKEIIIGRNNFVDAESFSATMEREVESPLTTVPVVSKIEKIVIGENSFSGAKSFVIDNLPALKHVEIGNECFAQATTFEMDLGATTASEFVLIIGENCFKPTAAEGESVVFTDKLTGICFLVI